MATSSSVPNPFLGYQITEKLNKINHVLWRAQVLAAVRGARMESHITGKSQAPAAEVEEKKSDGTTVKAPNPAFEEWFARDQQVLGLILSSVGKEVQAQIVVAEMAAQAWSTVERMFSAQTRARTMNVRFALTTTKKGNLSIAEYFAKMKGYADEIAAAGKPMDDEDLASHICNGLDAEYNPVVTSVTARIEPISIPELYAQLLSFETRLDLQDGSVSANAANRSGGARSNYNGGRGNSDRAGRGRGSRGRGPSRDSSRESSSRGRGQQRGFQRPASGTVDDRPLC